MRVTHVVQCGPTTGGTVSHVMTQAARQQELGVEVSVCAASDGLLAETCRGLGIPVVIEPLLNAQPAERELDPRFQERVTEALGRTKADLFHAHLRHAGIAAGIAGQRAGLPMVYTQHMGDRDPFLVLESAQRAEMPIIAVSQAVQDHTASYVRNPERIRYIPNGMDVPPDGGFRVPRRDRPNVLYCGRLVPEKGVDVAIIAFALLRDRLGEDATPCLHIVGIGADEPLLRRLVDMAGLGDLVTFHGSVPHAIHADAGVDLLIVPSRAEPCGLVVLEGMASGIPVLASDVGGIPEMLRGDTDGHLVRSEDPTALAAQIEEVLAHPDPERIANARRRFETKYTARLMAERTVELYRAILA